MKCIILVLFMSLGIECNGQTYILDKPRNLLLGPFDQTGKRINLEDIIDRNKLVDSLQKENEFLRKENSLLDQIKDNQQVIIVEQDKTITTYKDFLEKLLKETINKKNKKK